MGQNYLSITVAVILQALENGYQYGFDIMDVTGLPSGTVYPALRRLESDPQKPVRDAARQAREKIGG